MSTVISETRWILIELVLSLTVPMSVTIYISDFNDMVNEAVK